MIERLPGVDRHVIAHTVVRTEVTATCHTLIIATCHALIIATCHAL